MRHSISLILLAFGITACSSNGDSGSSTNPIASACSSDKTAETYTAGMSKTSGGVTVAIENANPAPPQQGTNYWTLRVTDSSGAPITDATIRVVGAMTHSTTYSHGFPVVPEISNQGGGEYEVKLIFNMGGHWDVTIVVKRGGTGDAGTMDAGTEDDVTFSFCM